MVPHLLKVQNFLSYGVIAPPLDFSMFKVACLSGANGQGKSALLEAMTWALWGEARKGSGDLLHTGAKRMVVDFTFEVEGTLYRVVRAFNRSESGKSTRAELELYVQQDLGTWQTLTEASYNLTDKRLAALLGVEYDTFVNASFLMQGRSDEFTRKTPASRKEVLANILDLSRYDALEAAAKERGAEVSQRIKTLEAQVAVLEEALLADADVESRVDQAVQHGKELKLSLEAAQVGLEAAQKALAEAVQGVQSIRAWKESAEGLRVELRAIEAEQRTLEERIAHASDLVAQRERLMHEAVRHEVLRVERERLLNLSALHGGLQHQFEANERRLAQRKAVLETQRTRLQERQIALEQQVEHLQTRVSAGSGLVGRRDEARADAAPLATLRDAERAHTERERQRQALETQLREARQAAQSRLDSLRKEDERLREAQKEAHVDPEAYAQTQRDVQRLAEVERELERLQEEGGAAGKEAEALRQAVEQCARDIARVDAQRKVVQHPESPRCPTCGTDLTPEHRRTVMAELLEERRLLEVREAEVRAREQAAREHVLRLREAFARLRAEKNTHAESPSRLATQEERLQQLARLREQRENLKQEGLALRARLEADPFDPELHARLETLARDAAQAPFDVAALRRAEAAAEREQALAAQVQVWEDDVRQLANTRDALTRQKTMVEQHVMAVDADPELTRGLELRRQISQQIDALGFDAARLSSVTQQVDALRDAPARLRDVVHAQNLLADAASSRASLAERRARTQSSLDALLLQLASEPRLREQEARARAEVDAAGTQVRTAQRAHADHQNILGGLQERRDKFRENNARRTDLNAKVQVAKEREVVYKHLRQAFGKNGIPALIIEHTVPEIEYRANELLDQLSQGKLHLRLETTRTKKDGGEAETLDVIVLDDTGAKRPYETFSGGEAFRINFALRLALSHILAERAGVRIRTLVIDEGFGTQDPEGISQLIEAIRTVQDSFDKILVISHLDEIKEAFPVRIEVRKEPVLGSTFDVIGVE